MIDWLDRHGFDDIVMSCGFLAEGVREVLGTGEPERRHRSSYVEEPEPLGTAGAVKLAEPVLDERFAVLNGDILTDFDLSRCVRFHEQRGATRDARPVSGRGSLLLRGRGDRRGRPRRGVPEKPAPGTAPTNHVNAGMYMLEHEVLEHIAGGRTVSFEREVFPSLVGAGLHGLPLEGYWMDIGTPRALPPGHARHPPRDRGDARSRPRARSTARHRPCWWARGCEIAPDAKVGPDVTLGDEVPGRGRGVCCGIVAPRRRGGGGGRGRPGQHRWRRTPGSPPVHGSKTETIIGEGTAVPPGAHLVGGRLPADG